MNTLAALNAIIAFCAAMIKGKQDPQGNFATAQEICRQLASLGGRALGRLLQRMNYIHELLNRLALPPMDEFRKFLDQAVQIIDCNARPFIPKDWKVNKHVKCGKFEWDPSKIILYFSDGQKKPERIEGNKLRQELAGKPVLNANVLDFLLANPHLIPEDWKGNYIFFWGTVYCNPNDDLYIRCLYWKSSTGKWNWHYYWLGHEWEFYCPAALLVK